MTVQIEHTLGGEPVRVVGPAPGSSSWAETIITAAGAAGGMLGLDVESRYMTDLGQFDPDFRVRTVQFSDGHCAWVLRLDDEQQYADAVSVLEDESVSFVSHSNMDVLSVYIAFGADITDRNLDTLSLARMADPDKEQDRDLKTLAAQYGMPELPAAEAAMYARFKELWPGTEELET